MIEFLSKWIEDITISIVIVAIFELILPKGNLSKYIKVVLGIYIIFCFISPFVNSKNLFDFSKIGDFIEEESKKVNANVDQSSMDYRLQDLYIKELKKDITNRINDNNYDVIECKIDANLDNKSYNQGIKKIEIIVKKKENNIELQNIFINLKENGDTMKSDKLDESNRLKRILADNYEIDTNIIDVNIK